jgi:hypothetical protein
MDSFIFEQKMNLIIDNCALMLNSTEPNEEQLNSIVCMSNELFKEIRKTINPEGNIAEKSRLFILGLSLLKTKMWADECLKEKKYENLKLFSLDKHYQFSQNQRIISEYKKNKAPLKRLNDLTIEILNNSSLYPDKTILLMLMAKNESSFQILPIELLENIIKIHIFVQTQKFIKEVNEQCLKELKEGYLEMPPWEDEMPEQEEVFPI